MTSASGWSVQDWRVFGTGARLVVPVEDDIETARSVVDAELAAVDLAASRFRDDSEISRLNDAGGARTSVSRLFAELIGVALDAARDTAGAVDPTLGAALRRLGYDRTFRQIAPVGPALPVAVTVRRQAGWQQVELDRVALTVRLPAGVQLDLGATAKAHAGDRAAARAAAVTGGPVLLSLGGDIAVAGPAPEGGWPIVIADDSNAPTDAPGPVVVITTGGLATSSTTVRRWERGGEVVHHLLDPVSCLPTRGPWRTVSVAATSCLAANVAATAAVVMGFRAIAWLAGQGLPARLVTEDGTITTTAGWPEETEL